MEKEKHESDSETGEIPARPKSSETAGAAAPTTPGLPLFSILGYVLRSLLPRINRGPDATGERRKTARRAARDSRRRTRLDAAAEKETAAR